MCLITPQELTEDELKRVERFEHDSKLGILEVQRSDDRIIPTLINGRPVDRSDWLEVVRIGNRSCTATMVGPRCAVTAAHCGKNNERSNVEIYQGPNVAGRVVHHPRYRNKSNYDLAVIVLDSDVSVPFATVGFDHVFTTGQDVDIAGYGCTRPGGGGGNDGILRWGESKVTGMTGTDVITQWRPGGAALCFGDSGGPMFADGSNTGKRTIVAVNSKGNIRDTNYNMRLNWDVVKEWFENIADQYDLEIYGLNNDDDDGPPPPPPGGDFEKQYSAIYADQCRRQIEYLESEIERFETGPSSEPGSDISGLTFGL